MTFADVYSWLRTKGWRLEITTKQHVRCIPPGGGRFIVSSGREGDFRAVRNFLRDLRRIAGVEYPRR